jgi:hypothetical protein
MAQASKRSRALRPAEINPEDVVIRTTKPKRGRPITVTATIKNYGECKLTLAKDTAVRLEGDMLWHAQNVAVFHRSDLIQNSLIGDMLSTAIGPVESTRHQYVLSCIREGIEGFGPWIIKFVDRVSGTKPPTKDDALLLKKILVEAKKSGYEKRVFYSRNQPSRISKSTLTAFLIEYCLGGAEWWKNIRLIPPLKLSILSIQRQQGQTYGKKGGPLNLFRHYLGSDYIRKLKRPKILIVVPPRIRSLQ